jgi:hypothetical protein
MNVYQRPLFRQAGGPVAPGMAGMEAVMGQGQMEGAAAGQLLQQSEQAMAQQMEGVGAQYADTLMSTLDQAEDFKSVIDALRGNEVPIQQRYAELAQYVGEEDAQATPESVLAMVQPTIMLTEEGAMESGIGDLMRQISSEVDMELPSGEPTPAGQGVGSLMAAGQPVQQFNRGGAVARFRNGGAVNPLGQFYGPGLSTGQMSALQAAAAPAAPASTTARLPSLESMYEQTLPMYQRIMGSGGQDRELAESQILFDIARRGLAFAGGVSPDTGESMAGQPIAAQFARAAMTLPTTIGEQTAGLRKQDQALKLAALQGAQGTYEAKLKAALETTKLGEGDVLFDAMGREIARGPEKPVKPIVAPPGSQIRDASDPSNIIATVPANAEKPNIKTVIKPDGSAGNVYDLSIPSEYNAARAEVGSTPGSYLDTAPNRASTTEGERAQAMLSNEELLEKIENGTATPTEMDQFALTATKYALPSTVEQQDSAGRRFTVTKPGNPLTPRVENVLREHMSGTYYKIFSDPSTFQDRRIFVPKMANEEGAEDVARQVDPVAFNLGLTVYMPLDESGVFPIEPSQLFPELDFGKATGFPGFFNTATGKFADFFSNSLLDEEAFAAAAAVDGLKVAVTRLAAGSYPGGRAPVEYLKTWELLKPQFGKIFTGNAENAVRLTKLVNELEGMEVNLMHRAYGPYSADEKNSSLLALNDLRPVLAKAKIVQAGLQKGIGRSRQTEAGENTSGSGSLLQKHIRQSGG